MQEDIYSNYDDDQSISSTDSGPINCADQALDGNCIHFILTNARSLAHKITSLIDMVQELDLNFAAITETWFKGGVQLKQELSDIEQVAGIKVLCRNRDGRRKARGGGVALAFKTSSCHFKERKLRNPSGVEILSVVGNVGEIKRKVVAIVLYIPPDTAASRMELIRELVGTEIAAVKTAFVDPIILICGDINGKNIEPAFDVDGDIQAIRTGPTRGENTLDVVFSNIGEYVKNAGVLPPLETESGTVSDHKCVEISAALPQGKKFTYIRKTTRRSSEAADTRFAEELRGVNWGAESGAGPDSLVLEFTEKVGQLTDKHFPLQTIRRRSNEHPWITNGIRRRAKRKKRLYRQTGRSEAWKRAEESMLREVASKRQQFVDKILNLPSKNYYAAVKQLAGHDSKKSWSVLDLFPGVKVEAAGRQVLDYLAGVGGDEAPSELPEVPQVEDAGLGRFDATRVEALLRRHKKTTSTVEGDPMPHLIQKYPAHFAGQVASIFNEVNLTASWPTAWKKEYLTIIPKTPRPGSLAECRNISCTSFLSKVLEGVLLEKLRQELVLDPDQFGGAKGCGAEHMMVELWDRVLRVLDGGDQAACLLGIDFEKAFNRMDHGHCLRQLKRLGASESSLALVASFLSGRSMTIDINGVSCGERKILRGSPQGSVLGCLLYCVTTQTLTDDITLDVRTTGPASEAPEPRDTAPHRAATGWPALQGTDPVQIRRPRFFPAGSDSDSSEEDVHFWGSGDEDSDNDIAAHRPTEQAKVKYVDDTTVFQAVDMDTAIRHVSAGPTTEVLRPVCLEVGLENLARRAEDIGMRVNVEKTQLLCISPLNGCNTTASIKPRSSSGWVESGNRMKLVGFTFGPTPSAAYHVDAIREEYRRKVWMLFHLHESGIRGQNLFKLYCCYIRSKIEYLSAAYHSMLLVGQAEALERLHRYAVRVCFGFDVDVGAIMQERGIEPLAVRRQRRVDTFISKAANNPRFAHWFPMRNADHRDLRSMRKI